MSETPHASPASSGEVEAIVALLHTAKHILITSHARPDGDAIGSSLGAAHMLRSLGKTVTVAFADPVPDAFQRLPGAGQATQTLPPAGTVDAVLVLECDSYARTGYPPDALAQLTSATINIDHHVSGRRFARLNWIDAAAPAVGVMIFQLAALLQADLSADACTCLYAALITDTGSFTYRTTTADTFAMAESLLRCGADAYAVSQQVFASHSLPKLRITAVMLNRIVVEDGFAWSYIDTADREAVGASVEDCEGLVNHLISLTGVEAAAFLRAEDAGGKVRVSLRSRGMVDVSAVAERFGGGGHRNASGFAVAGTPQSVAQALLVELHGAGKASA